MAEDPLSKDRPSTANAGETKYLIHFVSEGVMAGRLTGTSIALFEIETPRSGCRGEVEPAEVVGL